MLPDRVSNPGPLTYESGALPIALRGPATIPKYQPLQHMIADHFGGITTTLGDNQSFPATSLMKRFCIHTQNFCAKTFKCIRQNIKRKCQFNLNT